METTLEQIKQIILDTDRDMDRLISLRDELRIEAYEKIHEILSCMNYISPQKRDA